MIESIHEQQWENELIDTVFNTEDLFSPGILWVRWGVLLGLPLRALSLSSRQFNDHTL